MDFRGVVETASIWLVAYQPSAALCTHPRVTLDIAFPTLTVTVRCRKADHFNKLQEQQAVAANGAQKRTRTSTTLRSPAPEAGASTNSAIWARGRSGALGEGVGGVNRLTRSFFKKALNYIRIFTRASATGASLRVNEQLTPSHYHCLTGIDDPRQCRENQRP